jgi:hypothetical protein
MTSPQVSQVNNQPDYSKVRGWLLVFAIYEGFFFLFGVISLLTSLASQIHTIFVYLGYVMLPVHLSQCVAIFRRLRVGRTLSLVAYGFKILLGLVWLRVTAGFFLDAPLSAYFSAAVGPALSVASFLYFLRSERVKKTLVN